MKKRSVFLVEVAGEKEGVLEMDNIGKRANEFGSGLENVFDENVMPRGSLVSNGSE